MFTRDLDLAAMPDSRDLGQAAWPKDIIINNFTLKSNL